MKKSDFFYELPEKNIAQKPLEPRDSSKIMVYNRKINKLDEISFKNIINYLNKGDVLVLNNTKVLPARIYGKRETGAEIEFLLLKEIEEKVWETLVKPGKKAKKGHRFIFNEDLSGEITDILENGNRIIKFNLNNYNEFFSILEKIGTMPLPHYIKESLVDQKRYQTIFAKDMGSSAAPTAGLHFTDKLIFDLIEKGIEIEYITLHVGLGTFRPVKEENIENHHMHSEFYTIDKTTADKINIAKRENRRVIAVGTTSCRALESATDDDGELNFGSRETDIFITPGYKFKIINGLITNFHLPESTLIMLVSAFMGYDKTFELYKYAIKNNYRFFSFGDAMMIT